jgi:hypothetical protein
MVLAAAAIIFLLVQVVRSLPNDDVSGVTDEVAASDTTAPTTAAPTTAAPSAATVLATELRAEAARLTGADGVAAPELAARLRLVADQVERGDAAAPIAATGVIFDVARWRQANQLGDAATVNAIQLLQRIDGVAVAGSAPAPTSPPAAAADDGKGKKDKKND